MDSRKIACGLAASFIAASLIGVASSSSAKPKEVVVVARVIDPELQRTVSYADLNLAQRPDQKTLTKRISITATNLCFDLNWPDFDDDCRVSAIHSTDDQVAMAIERAQRQMAGLPIGPAITISMVVGAR